MRLGKVRLKKPEIELYNTRGLSAQAKHALNMVIVAVMFGNVFTVVTTSAAWSGYQRALGANSMQMGVISAIPVAASTVQIFASYLLESRQNRRTLLLVFGLVHRLCWVLIGLVPVLLAGGGASTQLYAVMVVLAIASCGNSFLNVSYYSLVGDLVPMQIRGGYFAVRQCVAIVTGVVAALLVGIVLDRTQGIGGYVAVLLAAGISGALDICCYFFIQWPPMQRRQRSGDTFGAMLREVLANRPYMRIVGIFTLWFFAVNLIAPFFNVFLLEEIRMSYTEIAIYNQIVPNVATLFVVGWWGRQMDRYGSQPVAQTVGLYCMLLPLTYLFLGPRSFWLLPLANLFNGMTMPVCDLAQQNIYLAKAPARNRTMYVAVFFTSTQLLGTALSNFAGGLLMQGPFQALEQMQFAFCGCAVNRYDYLFLLSALLRCGCVLGLFPLLRAQWETPARQMCRAFAQQARQSARYRCLAWRAARLRRRYRWQNSQKNRKA